MRSIADSRELKQAAQHDWGRLPEAQGDKKIQTLFGRDPFRPALFARPFSAATLFS